MYVVWEFFIFFFEGRDLTDTICSFSLVQANYHVDVRDGMNA